MGHASGNVQERDGYMVLKVSRLIRARAGLDLEIKSTQVLLERVDELIRLRVDSVTERG